MIKTLIATTAMITALSSAAFAQSHQVHATVTDVASSVSTIAESVPTTVCDTVRVPITETRRSGGGSGDTLAGMIVGGLIGKGATGDDKGAAVGAVIGGMIASDGKTYQVVTGYRKELQCNEVYKTQYREVVSGYEVSYEWNGLGGMVYTTTQYQVGDTILINITMN